MLRLSDAKRNTDLRLFLYRLNTGILID